MFLSTAYGDEYMDSTSVNNGVDAAATTTGAVNGAFSSQFQLGGTNSIILYDANGNALLCDVSQVNIQQSDDGQRAIITPIDKVRHRKRSSGTGKPLGRPKTIKDAPEKLAQQTPISLQDIQDAKAVLERQSSKRKNKQLLLHTPATSPPPPPPPSQVDTPMAINVDTLQHPIVMSPTLIPTTTTNIDDAQSNYLNSENLFETPQQQQQQQQQSPSKVVSKKVTSRNKKKKHTDATPEQSTMAQPLLNEDDVEDSIWTFTPTPRVEAKRGRKPKASKSDAQIITNADNSVKDNQSKKRKTRSTKDNHNDAVATTTTTTTDTTAPKAKKQKKHKKTTAEPSVEQQEQQQTEPMLVPSIDINQLVLPLTPPPSQPQLFQMSEVEIDQMLNQNPDLLLLLMTQQQQQDEEEDELLTNVDLQQQQQQQVAIPHDSMFIENKHKRDVLFSKRFKTLVQKSHLLHAMTRYRVFLVTQTQNIDDYHVVLPSLPKSGDELKQAFDSHLIELEKALDTLRSMSSSQMSTQEILKNQHLAIMMGNMSQLLFNPETTVTFEDSSNPTHQSSKRKPRFEHNNHRPHITTPYLGRIVDDPVFLKAIKTPAASPANASVHVRGLSVRDHHETSFVTHKNADTSVVPVIEPSIGHNTIVRFDEEDGARIILPTHQPPPEEDIDLSYNNDDDDDATRHHHQSSTPLVEEPQDQLMSFEQVPPASIRQQYLDAIASSTPSSHQSSRPHFEKSFQTVQGFDATLYNLPRSIPTSIRTETTVTTTTKTTMYQGDIELVRFAVDKLKTRVDYNKRLLDDMS